MAEGRQLLLEVVHAALEAALAALVWAPEVLQSCCRMMAVVLLVEAQRRKNEHFHEALYRWQGSELKRSVMLCAKCNNV